MVAHAYLEVQRQEAEASAPDPEVQVAPGDIQRQHQALTRPLDIARVFDLAKSGFWLETVYQRLAAKKMHDFS